MASSGAQALEIESLENDKPDLRAVVRSRTAESEMVDLAHAEVKASIRQHLHSYFDFHSYNLQCESGV